MQPCEAKLNGGRLRTRASKLRAREYLPRRGNSALNWDSVFVWPKRPFLGQQPFYDRLPDLLSDSRAVCNAASRGGNWIVDCNSHRPRMNPEITPGHDLVRSRYRNRNDRHASLNRHDKDAPLKTLQAPGAAPSSFREDKERDRKSV